MFEVLDLYQTLIHTITTFNPLPDEKNFKLQQIADDMLECI